MNGQRGTMVVSLDLELCWGRFDKVPVPMLEADASEERIQIKRLLALLDRYEIPATWAIVGHLMLAGCSRHAGAAHTDVMPRPDYSWFRRTGTSTTLYERDSITRLVCSRYSGMDQGDEGAA